MSEELIVERHDGFAQLTLNRPERRNAMTDELLLDLLPATFEELNADADVRAIIVAGAGGAFCSGADLSCSGLSQPSPSASREFMHRSHQTVVAIRNSPKIVIAAMHGAAAGAGLALGVVCDVRIAARDARFMAPFLALGISPDWGSTYLLPRAVGPDRALEIFLTGRAVSADEAVEIGLVSRLADDPLAEAVELAKTVASLPPLAVAATKRSIYASLSAPDFRNYVFDVEIPQTAVALHGEEFRHHFALYMERMSRR